MVDCSKSSVRREPLDLTVVILCYNEALHITRAIDSLRGVARDILVVDSYSSDKTVDLAEICGVRVLRNKFVNQARQFQWAMDHGSLSTEWVMRLDADEVLEIDLVDELYSRLREFPADVVGVILERKHIFMGRWIRHGGRFPLRLMRVWRRGHGQIEDRWMDEHIVVSGGSTVTMKGGFADWNLQDLTYFTEKHNKYASREAIVRLDHKYSLFRVSNALALKTGSKHAAAKRWIKESIYNKLPFWAAPLGYFLYRYFIQLGFLDGYQGLIYHVLQGFWYRFLVEAKTIELDAAIADCQTKDQRIARLAKLTGLSLS